jgi:hypothetical protein
MDREKSIDKIQHSFMIESLSKLGRERWHHNTTKAIYYES